MPVDRCSLYEAVPTSSAPGARVASALAALAELRTPGQGIVSVIESDHRVYRARWLELDELLDCPRSAATGVLREWCRHHLLEGPECEVRRPLGRAVELRTFCEFLSGHPQLTLSEAEELVFDLLDEDRWTNARYRAKLLDLDIGVHVIWATFDPTGGDPFAFASSKVELERELGFYAPTSLRDPDPRDRKQLLLTYDPGGIRFLFPTCMEAGASEPWNYYFSVAPRGARWGMTKAWGDNAEGTSYRPEVVHRPTPLGDITERVRLYG